MTDPGPYGPAWVWVALEALNARRRARGLPSLALEPGLCRAANELAVGLGDGSLAPHAGFPDRVRAHGWPYRAMGIRNAGFGNLSEGNSWGGQDPAECVLILDDAKSPTEPHRRDFEDPAFTHVGISICPLTFGPWVGRGVYAAVVEYGAR